MAQCTSSREALVQCLDHRQMEPENKRLLSIAAHQSLHVDNSLPSSTPPDLALQLRNLGARVRRNVSQGYIQPPSHHSSFSKSASSNSIFRSANDTLRDVYSTASASMGAKTPDPPRKRDRSCSDQEDTDEVAVDNHGHEMKLDAVPNIVQSTRIIKPLRASSRKSMSDSVLTFQRSRGPNHPPPSSAAEGIAEEEDWSEMALQDSGGSGTSFQPISFS
ncbi:hypothetical protein CC2G_010559 [Coprinopsis cinerea AmutBmut pab1-1]|nr:hypothetical protein CC2G_010559 [Coprinopsis cinerea AmutBmut pab1-1]